jgi:hypothetical protein
MSSRTHHLLHAQLVEWAGHYGGDQFRRLGYSSVERITLHPDVPGASRAAQEVEHQLRRMEQIGRWREARVLRCEYLLAAKPEGERLAALGRIGLRLGRSAYYRSLHAALAFMDGALHLVERAA